MEWIVMFIASPILIVVLCYIVHAIIAFCAMWLDCEKHFPSYELVKECCIKDECKEDFKVRDYIGLFLV